uniref:Arginine biosynthesis bifunctional protein ArgJ, mitochondrial n=1 Tax=Albugo laibachii Nc14 TaxID=890382 RepID=F0VZM9_9STRA|nr:arginine biosynthesis bifunctional protein argJ puta [Albugo laibachii Nc14]|eukprot:CCA14259.1 arginine biosynthesis bifunctional protein argJ puta [Albugo laibachii Nc14]
MIQTLSCCRRFRSINPKPFSSWTSPSFAFQSKYEYLDYLKTYHSRLPVGFSVGSTSFDFVPQEAPHLPASMTMSLIKPVEPTPLFSAVFTKNAFPGAPIILGRQRVKEPMLGAILINNKISNVCAVGGIHDSTQVCSTLAKQLRFTSERMVFPSSTGVIGWRLPVDAMMEHMPQLVDSLQSECILPVAKGIMTTDLYPKIRSVDRCGGRIVGIAKGAGMVEPDMATMLSYVLTDIAIPREVLRQTLIDVVNETYNAMSVDTDQSTSDTVAIVSSNQIPFEKTYLAEFKQGLQEVCARLCEDIVRNGEGAHHVIQVVVRGSETEEMAKGVGKSVINSPLLKCAVAGNDPNVGRLVMAIGKYMGKYHHSIDIFSKLKISMGGVRIFENGEFKLNHDIERLLIKHLKKAQLTESTRGGVDVTSRNYPPHNNFVEIDIDLGLNNKSARVIGCDLTHEYVAINADYRS